MEKINKALRKLHEKPNHENITNINTIIQMHDNEDISKNVMIDIVTNFLIKEKLFDYEKLTNNIINMYLSFIKINLSSEYIFKIIENSSSYKNQFCFIYSLVYNKYKLTQQQFDKYVQIIIQSKPKQNLIRCSSQMNIIYPFDMNQMKLLFHYTSELNMDSIFNLYLLDIMDIDSDIINIIYRSPEKIIELLAQTNKKKEFTGNLFKSKIINKFLSDLDIKNNPEYIINLASNDCVLYFFKENIEKNNCMIVSKSLKEIIFKNKSYLIFDFLLNDLDIKFSSNDLEFFCSYFFDNWNNKEDINNLFKIIFSLLNNKIAPTSLCLKNLINNFADNRNKLINFLDSQDIIHWYRQKIIEQENEKIKYILDAINIFENFGYVLNYEDLYILTKNKITINNIKKYNFDFNDNKFQEICAEYIFFPYDMKLKQEYLYLIFKNKHLLRDIFKIINNFNLKVDIKCLETLCKLNRRPILIKTIMKKYNLKLDNNFIKNLPKSNIKSFLLSQI